MKYLDRLTEEKLQRARRSLEESFRSAPLEACTFLDVGCGSGVFSLSALELGAREVISTDVDPWSIECASRLRAYAGDPANWSIRQGSILDAGFVDSLRPVERVYSWGVLHHTGQMWLGLENCLSRVRPGGFCSVALYRKPNHVKAQLVLKRTYNVLPEPLRPVMRWAYSGLHMARLISRGANPRDYLRTYSERSRGMSYSRDVEDWLGGLPFEFAEEAEVRAFLEQRDFELQQVVRAPPGGNNEYLAMRAARHANAPSSSDARRNTLRGALRQHNDGSARQESDWLQYRNHVSECGTR